MDYVKNSDYYPPLLFFGFHSLPFFVIILFSYPTWISHHFDLNFQYTSVSILSVCLWFNCSSICFLSVCCCWTFTHYLENPMVWKNFGNTNTRQCFYFIRLSCLGCDNNWWKTWHFRCLLFFISIVWIR